MVTGMIARQAIFGYSGISNSPGAYRVVCLFLGGAGYGSPTDPSVPRYALHSESSATLVDTPQNGSAVCLDVDARGASSRLPGSVLGGPSHWTVAEG